VNGELTHSAAYLFCTGFLGALASRGKGMSMSRDKKDVFMVCWVR